MMCFESDDLFIIAAALELAYEYCETQGKHELADRFAEIYNRVDERLSEERNGDRLDQVTQEAD